MTNIGEDKAGKATSLVGLHRQGAPQGCITFSSVVNREPVPSYMVLALVVALSLASTVRAVTVYAPCSGGYQGAHRSHKLEPACTFTMQGKGQDRP